MMNTYILILLILFGGAFAAYFLNKLAPILSGLTAFAATTIATILFYTQVKIGSQVQLTIGGINLEWGINAYSWLFSFIVLGLGTLASLYSIQYMQNKERQGYFYLNFLLSIGAMMGILLSHDFVSFFIFWEIMTWSSFLIVIYNGKDVKKIGIKYMIFSAIGAYAMLMSIVMIFAETKSFLISDFINLISTTGFSNHILMITLLLIGFGVKAAVMPLHVWAVGAYSNSPMSYTSVFSGALSKMGIYGFGIVMLAAMTYVSPTISENAGSGYSIISIEVIKIIFQWLGAITAIMGTLYALKQTDAKKLLAYSSIAQLGYIITGIAVGTKLAVMSALFLAVLHGIFKGTLFMAVGAIERQTGTTDMTKISGLIRKMPWTFIASLMSIIALAGIPPLAGFVPKWLLYEGLITSGHYFLVILLFFSSTAAFLYCYRFLFGLFLGQEEEETKNVKEAPASMVIPMMFLAGLTLVFGTYPGLLFKPIANAMEFVGMHDVTWNMTVLSNVWGDTVSLNLVSIAIFVIFISAALFLFKGMRGTRYVTTKDISTSGEIPTENENLTYQLDFFKPFERAVDPLYKRTMDKIYNAIGESLEAVFDFTRSIYTGNGQTYAIYVIVFVVILLIFKDSIF